MADLLYSGSEVAELENQVIVNVLGERIKFPRSSLILSGVCTGKKSVVGGGSLFTYLGKENDNANSTRKDEISSNFPNDGHLTALQKERKRTKL